MKNTPQLIIFDMDGTLTRPAIDFDRIRAQLGIASGSILEALEAMTPLQRQRADTIIEEHERIAARDSELQDGVHDVVDYLRSSGIRVAIATRNSRKSVRTVLEKHYLKMDHVYTREDGAVKPSPQPVLAICEYFGTRPEACWVVGDYLYDIQSGGSAGATTVLMVGDGELPEYSDQADHVIRDLRELTRIIGDGELI